MKPSALALMGTASFYGGVHHKRYSGQQETAPNSAADKKRPNFYAEPFKRINNLLSEIIYFFAFNFLPL